LKVGKLTGCRTGEKKNNLQMKSKKLKKKSETLKSPSSHEPGEWSPRGGERRADANREAVVEGSQGCGGAPNDHLLIGGVCTIPTGNAEPGIK